ncbi:hypothetical protein [Candidatus Enterococcus murrayae]|uniref:Phage tail protein n=1 Tax=Candidatus Enterococcus murrayae TaxID=2815321 RepID=A0ABS3HBC1_9ENTE|nr:hypothetical protein [Enterococcus sp. MJM16]MBO0450751.1 hypothetical protein [Enterococcus sp. MJM16]
MNDFITVYIDYVPSVFWRICLTERPEMPVPNQKYINEEVLGKNGAFYSKYAFKDMDVTLTFNYLEEVTDFKAFKAQMPYIRKWLADGTRLEFSDEPNAYYLIRQVEFKGNITNDMIEYGEFDVNLTLAPFARINEQPIEMPRKLIGTQYLVNTFFYNRTVEDSQPTIILNTTENIELYFNSDSTASDPIRPMQWINTNLPKATFTSKGSVTFYIDSEKGLVNYSLGGINENPQQVLTQYNAPDGLFKLPRGNHRISVDPYGISEDRRTASVNKLLLYRNGLK